MHIRLVLVASAVSLSGCAVPHFEQSKPDPCVQVQSEYDDHEQRARDLDDEIRGLGERPTDYEAATNWDIGAKALAGTYIAEKRVQARMITNDRACFSPSDLADAQEFLDNPLRALATAAAGSE